MNQRMGLLLSSREAIVPGLRRGNEHHLAYGEHSEGDNIPIKPLSTVLFGGVTGLLVWMLEWPYWTSGWGSGRARGANSSGGGGTSTSRRGRTTFLGAPVSFWTSLRKSRGSQWYTLGGGGSRRFQGFIEGLRTEWSMAMCGFWHGGGFVCCVGCWTWREREMFSMFSIRSARK